MAFCLEIRLQDTPLGLFYPKETIQSNISVRNLVIQEENGAHTNKSYIL